MSQSTNSDDKKLIEAYKKISPRYEKLKRRPWKDFQHYFKTVLFHLPSLQNSIIIDIGSGNGRNLLLFEEMNAQLISLDFSFELLKHSVISSNDKLHRINNDMRYLCLKEKTIDFALCIASIHHLRTTTDVISTLKLIYKILNEGGFVILSCWRRWKPSSIKRMIKDILLYIPKKIKKRTWRHGDIYLPWFDENKNIIAQRYYHLFTKAELKKIIRKTNFSVIDFSILGGKSNRDNFFLLLRK